MFRRGEGNSTAQESDLQLYRRWTFSSDEDIEEFKCDRTFADQSLPEGSNTGLICKEEAQVTAGWQGLGPQVQVAQYQSTQKEEESRSSEANPRSAYSQFSDCQASLMLSWVIRLARQGKDLHGIATAQLRQGPELIYSSWAEGQRPWAKLPAAFSELLCLLSGYTTVPWRADSESKQLNSWQGVYGGRKVAKPVGALGALTCISLSFTEPVCILLYLLWPCSETSLKQFSVIWSGANSALFVQLHH